MRRSLQQGDRVTGRRRGVTLVEMLVTLAVLLLMMTVIVQIFQAATGALSAAQVYQELDNQLRLLDSTIRSDLDGVTCRLTPPNDPRNNLGYFEYGENEFADVQGEDSDDYIRFTAKAPAGRPFTGRMWIGAPGNTTLNQSTQPTTITSEYAEIIYFLRNGNLYRRVFLVAPQRQSTIVPTVRNVYVNPVTSVTTGFNPAALGGNPAATPPTGNQVSWQGVNDLSAHPAPRGAPTASNPNSVILNTLGDLTNRENRSFYARFGDDFEDLNRNHNPDGLADDFNGDNVPDYYPTLYPGVFSPASSNGGTQLVFEPPFPGPAPAFRLTLPAFPYIFPGAYSCPQVLSTGTAPYGWIHSPNPQAYTNAAIPYDTNPLGYLQALNHNPIDIGDNLPLPPSPPQTFLNGTWWGFPTWRETLSPLWTDPTFQVNVNHAQPFGLNVRDPTTVPVDTTVPAAPIPLIPPRGDQLLPDMTSTWRNTPQPFNDGSGGSTGFFSASGLGSLWGAYSWEDDLIMTGVRSFDIKAYDNALAGYVDLGWGDDPRVIGGNSTPYLVATVNPTVWNGGSFDTLNQTFAHEGRIPPLVADNRYDAQFNQVPVGYYGAAYSRYDGNVGDDNPNVNRLRRVWDSWSTEYTVAPGTGVNSSTFFPAGPPFTPPIYPSYPPPYPAPLRGIQIQIRVTDPTSQRIKTLTIRQDFTDKL